MSNALLREQGALGYTTELLSGDYNAPFGRSSHHQVWSEAMTVTPLVRGLLGLEFGEQGSTVRIAPQLPADWNRVMVRRVRAGESVFDFELLRSAGELRVTFFFPEGMSKGAGEPLQIELAPAFPLDARVRSVTVGGKPVEFEVERAGDVQSAVFEVDARRAGAPVLARRVLTAVVKYDEGTDVYLAREAPRPGDTNAGLRVLRSRAEQGGLRLLLEGLAGREYSLRVRGPKPLAISGEGLSMTVGRDEDWTLGVKFTGEPGRYVRREVVLPFVKPLEAPPEFRRKGADFINK